MSGETGEAQTLFMTLLPLPGFEVCPLGPAQRESACFPQRPSGAPPMGLRAGVWLFVLVAGAIRNPAENLAQ